MTLPPVDRSALISARRDLHQHPELGFEETRTGALVADRLRALGYAVTTQVGRTGVVGLLDGGGGSGRCVMLRADMDALPVEEATDVPYRSRQPGKMHACGHDGHVAIGLEVARRLHAARLPGGGVVKLAFQPAEEIAARAQAMIAAGVREAPRVDAAFGGSAEVRYRRLCRPTVNDERMTGVMAEAATEIVGKGKVASGVRTMGGEDMSFFLAQVPGCFAFVGSAPRAGKASPHHSPT